MNWRILQGCCLDSLRSLPSESVQCCVTSPPYWGLRDYGCEGQLGLEVTPEEYVAGMVNVFREVRRVLREDGTLWLNLGDSYVGARGGAQGQGGECADRSAAAQGIRERGEDRLAPGLKPKDLGGIPWRVAFALQADGWWLRSDIIWAKPNPMPESVTDRPTKAHEYLFLLTKSERYFYDALAVAEAATGQAPRNGPNNKHESAYRNGDERMRTRANLSQSGARETRNRRTVWTVASQPHAEAHFAVMPEALVEPCIRAGTSAHGACVDCGEPFGRVTERVGGPPNGRFKGGLAGDCKTAHSEGTVAGAALSRLYREHGYPEVRTVGWRARCGHGGAAQPCLVLDPFSGSGTVGVVALKLGRSYVGCELNPAYVEMSRRRVGAVSPLLAREDAPIGDLGRAKDNANTEASNG
jgi:DNA modification methylase